MWVPFALAVAAYFVARHFVGHTFGLATGVFVALMGVLAFFHKQTRRRLLDCQDSLKSLKNLPWREFEMLVGEAYRRKGYTVEETGGGPDGGVDLVLRRDGETVLVQCKRWKAHTVGVPVVRELYGVLMSEQATRALLVTSGEFTADAHTFAQGKPLELVNGPALLELVRGVQTVSRAGIPDLAAAPKPAPPDCPRCARPMVLRTAGRGASAGSPFWGCPD